ncbi:MAG: hypothetical protein PSX80_13755 [bacterium]|nr:hypothetical protein [bacterium]
MRIVSITFIVALLVVSINAQFDADKVGEYQSSSDDSSNWRKR